MTPSCPTRRSSVLVPPGRWRGLSADRGYGDRPQPEESADRRAEDPAAGALETLRRRAGRDDESPAGADIGAAGVVARYDRAGEQELDGVGEGTGWCPPALSPSGERIAKLARGEPEHRALNQHHYPNPFVLSLDRKSTRLNSSH